jgi:Fic family protein
VHRKPKDNSLPRVRRLDRSIAQGFYGTQKHPLPPPWQGVLAQVDAKTLLSVPVIRCTLLTKVNLFVNSVHRMRPGTYKQAIQGYRTFVPNPLPPELRLARETERLVEEATHRLGQVEMCRMLLPNVDLLVYGSLRREALASSTIEGTIASADELIRYQVSEFSEREAVREVNNYATALQWGVEQLQSLPLSSRLILGLHAILLNEVRGGQTAGRFKDRQNYIGTHPLESIEQAVFVPPQADDVPALIGDLERYINQACNEPRVVQCALTHYQFETIHPFNDGNGRVGRLLIVLQMIQLGLLSAPLIYPSVYFERTRSQYYECLQAVRDQRDWDRWVAFFARGIVEQCGETVILTRTILDLRQQFRTVGHVRRRATINQVLDAFFHEPVRTVRQICDYTNLNHTSVQPALDDLAGLNIVYELTGKQKGRVYACRPVLDALFGVGT